MNHKSLGKRLHRLQSGQALTEYWPTIPVAIAVMVGASILVGAIGTAFLKTANGLEGYCKPETEIETTAQIYDHQIVSSARVYDPNTNRTTIAFTVTSGSQPSISHWVLGVPKGVADHVISASESWAWTNSDPTTGAMGMKFDIGYSSTSPTDGGGGNGGGGNGGGGNGGGGGGNGGGGSGGGGNGGGGGGNGGGGGGKGKPKANVIDINLLTKATSPEYAAFFALETRVISITLDGNYQFGAVTVTVKAGVDEIGSSTINGPIALADDQSNTDTNTNGQVDRSKGC